MAGPRCLMAVRESIDSHIIGQVHILAPAIYFILRVHKNKKILKNHLKGFQCPVKIKGDRNVEQYF